MRNLNNVRNSKTVTDISDISLIAQVTVFHNKQAFNRLVVKYQSPVRRFFLNQTMGDEQLSDDLAQDTFIRAYTSIGTFRGSAAFSTWLFRIAYNVFYDYRRRLRPSADDLDAARPAAAGADRPLGMDVYGALARLPDAERTCVTLQLVDGYPIERIAAITGMAEGTVKSHLFRGKQKLTSFLRQNGYS